MDKILLIEDDEPIRFLYKRQLEGSGFSVDAKASGKEALQAYEKNVYSLVLLDIMLPDINGLDILNYLSRKNMIGKSPIVLLTNLAQENIIKEGFKLGAIGYIIKAQIIPKELVEEVKKFISDKNYTTQVNTSEDDKI